MHLTIRIKYDIPRRVFPCGLFESLLVNDISLTCLVANIILLCLSISTFEFGEFKEAFFRLGVRDVLDLLAIEGNCWEDRIFQPNKYKTNNMYFYVFVLFQNTF